MFAAPSARRVFFRRRVFTFNTATVTDAVSRYFSRCILALTGLIELTVERVESAFVFTSNLINSSSFCQFRTKDLRRDNIGLL